MALRIVIQRQIQGQWKDTDLFYELEDVFGILRARLREALTMNEKEIVTKRLFRKPLVEVKREWDADEVDKALESACQFFEKEFKLRTVSMS